MKCPTCNGPTTVLETRDPRRRRRCDSTACANTFWTREQLDDDVHIVLDAAAVARIEGGAKALGLSVRQLVERACKDVGR